MLMVIPLIVGLLWLIGFFTPESDYYFRRPVQSALFLVTRITPNSIVAPVARLALKSHPEGTTHDEAKEIAQLFGQIGENEDASQLWLALARLDAESDRNAEAIEHAISSQNSYPNENALMMLVALNIKDSEGRVQWIAELQKSYPENELSQAAFCLTQTKSFESAISPSCQKVGWIFEKTKASKSENDKLAKRIENLPNETALNIKKLEDSISNKEAKEEEYYSDLAEIDRQKSSAIADGIIGVIVDLLPIPKPGDDLETFVAREGICLLPYVRWVCRAASLGPAFDAKKKVEELNKSRENILELIGLNNGLINSDRQKINYWQSSKPLEELKKAKNEVLPKFQNDVMETVYAKKESIGVSITEAITLITQ